MSESPLEKTDQMLRNMHPTWWRVLGREQNFDNSGVGAEKPWWEEWETDETAAKPKADAAVEKEGEWGEAAPPTGGMSSDSIPPPRTPPPRTPPPGFFFQREPASGWPYPQTQEADLSF